MSNIKCYCWDHKIVGYCFGLTLKFIIKEVLALAYIMLNNARTENYADEQDAFYIAVVLRSFRAVCAEVLKKQYTFCKRKIFSTMA